MSDEKFIEESFFEQIADLYPMDEPPKEAYPEDRVYKTVNIKITLEDEADLTYSVACPEWMYCMPTGNPHEIARQIIRATMMHNINVLKGGDEGIEVPI